MAPVGRDYRARFFYSGNIAVARGYLHTQGYVPRVSVTHKRDLRKLVVQLGTARMVLAREPARADESSSIEARRSAPRWAA